MISVYTKNIQAEHKVSSLTRQTDLTITLDKSQKLQNKLQQACKQCRNKSITKCSKVLLQLVFRSATRCVFQLDPGLGSLLFSPSRH